MNILEAEEGYGIYIGEHFHSSLSMTRKRRGARSSPRRTRLIVVFEVLARGSEFAGDTEWVSLSPSGDGGFASSNFPGVEAAVLIYKARSAAAKTLAAAGAFLVPAGGAGLSDHFRLALRNEGNIPIGRMFRGRGVHVYARHPL